jgi:hypothetical protein
MNAELVKGLRTLNSIVASIIILVGVLCGWSIGQQVGIVLGLIAGFFIAVLINGAIAALVEIERHLREIKEVVAEWAHRPATETESRSPRTTSFMAAMAATPAAGGSTAERR